MHIFKTCLYCSDKYNLLPALLVVPLRYLAPVGPTTTRGRSTQVYQYRIIGVRIALKFWCWHAGIELHFN